MPLDSFLGLELPAAGLLGRWAWLGRSTFPGLAAVGREADWDGLVAAGLETDLVGRLAAGRETDFVGLEAAGRDAD